MVQWTAKPAPREQAANPGNASQSDKLKLSPGPRDKAMPRKRSLMPLYVTMIVLIGAAIPAGYLLLAHAPAASERAPQDQAVHELTTGRIIIASEAGCRERGFNNYNGRSTEKGAIACSAIAPKSQNLTERLDTIRRAFAPQ